MKKGFTIIELIISMGILGIIFIVVLALFRVGVKEYPYSMTTAKMQSEVNFAGDSIAQNIKNSHSLPQDYGNGIHTRNSSALIIATPAVDANGDFVDVTTAFDYIVYRKNGTFLEKLVYGHPSGRNPAANGTPKKILDKVTSFSCTYSSQVSGSPTSYKTASCTINTQTKISGKNINFNVTKKATARNAP